MTYLALALAALLTAAPGDAGVRKPNQAVAKDAGVVDAGVKVAENKPVDAGVASPVRPAAPPLAPEVKALVDRVQAFYEKTADFTARFRQDYAYKAFKRTQTSSGTVTFKKPGKMRWEYEKPASKTFVLAGDKVYAYDPEAKLLTRAAIGTNTLSASVTFLWGQGKLADEFSIVKKPGALDAGVAVTAVLELTPLVVDPRFKKVLLEVDLATAQVVKSTVIDPDGSENAITFLDLKTNTGVDEKVFKLAPPAGTQVQDFTQQAGGAAQVTDGGAK
jgi:outer membrane lipoprotein carrier protein